MKLTLMLRGNMMKYIKFIAILMLSGLSSYIGSYLDYWIYNGYSQFFATIFFFIPIMYIIMEIFYKTR